METAALATPPRPTSTPANPRTTPALLSRLSPWEFIALRSVATWASRMSNDGSGGFAFPSLGSWLIPPIVCGAWDRERHGFAHISRERAGSAWLYREASGTRRPPSRSLPR